MKRSPVPGIIFVIGLNVIQPIFGEIDVGDGGWDTQESDIVEQDGKCNIERHSAKDFSQKEFEMRYAYSEPVIITDVDSGHFQTFCTYPYMMENWGGRDITLSSANTHSYKKLDTSLRGYVHNHLKPQDKDVKGNETFYLFGDIDRNLWSDLLSEYTRPKWTVPQHRGELSFGLAGAGTGVPFHIHGPGFAEVIYGEKKWFLYAPDEKPDFDPDESTLVWFQTKYPKLSRDKLPLECVLKPGELLYFPNMWWHATLNLKTSVFMSTFLSP